MSGLTHSSRNAALKWSERSILRIATYHKGLEGCDGFQNLFVIRMRLLVKGEKNPSGNQQQRPLPQHGTQGCRRGTKPPQGPSPPPSSR